MVSVGTVLGLACLPPIISRISVPMGWRSACLICALAIGVMILLIALLIIRNTPESMGLKPYGDEEAGDTSNLFAKSNDSGLSERLRELTPVQSLRTRSFWYLFIAYSLTGIPVQGLLSHVIIWGVEIGISSENSGLIMAILVIPSIPVRVMAGWLGDRFGKKEVLAFFNFCSLLLWLFGWFFIKDGATFYIFCLVLGFVYATPFSLYTPFLGDVFGRFSVGTLLGILTLGHGIIGGVGPFLWGWLADITGSYAINCIISAGLYVIITLSLWLIDPFVSQKVLGRSTA